MSTTGEGYMDDCHDIREQLSGVLDGELTPEIVRGVHRHLDSCTACQSEWEDLQVISQEIQRVGREVPSAPAWQSLERRLNKRGVKARTARKMMLTRYFSLRSAAAFAAIFFGSFFLTREFLDTQDTNATFNTPSGIDVQLYVQDVRSNPTAEFEYFLAAHHGKAVPPDLLNENVGFRPLVPRELPGGFRLHKSYVLTTRCCNGVYLQYVNGERVVALLQQAPAHPIEWQGEDLRDFTIAGVPCRRARVGNIGILHVEPEGKNVILVAQNESVNAEEFVASLAVP